MKILLIAAASLLLSLAGFGQSEPNDMITYDTTWSLPSSEGGPSVQITWRITRNTDTAHRPWYLFYPGAGQVGTDTNYLTTFLGHYWLKHGWDGSVVLGNGTHYPCMVTMITNAANVRPWYVQDALDTLIKYYHCRSISAAGLSEGGWTIGRLINYRRTGPTDDAPQKLISCFVALQGNAYDSFNVYSHPNAAWFGHWIVGGGHYAGEEGTTDTRNLWIWRDTGIVYNATCCYFTYENWGGGGHGAVQNGLDAWDWFVDPFLNDWRDVAPITNTNLVVNNNHANSMGNYTGPSETIFQWMLRNSGDTSLAGSGAPTVNPGSGQQIQYPASTASLSGSVTVASGRSVASTTWSQVSGPGTATITGGTTLTPTVSGLIPGTYVFKLTGIDNTGASNSANVNVVVLPEQAPTVSAGSNQTLTQPISSATLSGTITANGGATISSFIWTQVSGPVSTNIVSNDSLTTSVTGLTLTGTYTFKLSATDNNGNSSSANVTVTIQATGAPAVKPFYLCGAGEYQFFIIDSTGHFLYAIGTNLTTQGVNNTGITGLPLLVSITPYPASWAFCNGALHGGGAVDNLGNLYTFGDNAQGQLGIGNATQTLVGNLVRVDSSGNVFTGVASISAFFASNANNGWYAIKLDGSLWTWGNKIHGMALNGTDSTHSDTAAYLPAQVPIPGGKLAAKVMGGQHATVLMTDSTVSTGGASSAHDLGYAMTGTQYQLLHDIGLAHIIDICGSGPYNMALDVSGHLWGWGSWGSWLGQSVTSGPGTAIATPTRLTAIENAIYADAGASDTIKHIYANSAAIYYLTKAGKLYVNGDQSQGIGNCVHQFMMDSTSGPPIQFPNAWNAGINNTPLILPVRLLANWPYPIVAVWTNFPFVYYAWFEDSKGNLFSTGRNKGAVLGNGVIGTTSSNQAATYGNAWDDSCVNQIWPFALLYNIKVPVPWCVLYPNGSPCNEYAIPTHSYPSVNVLNGIAQQVTGGTSITLSATAVPVSPAHVATYFYTVMSGPNTPTIVSPPNSSTLITGLIPGRYDIRLTVTDSDDKMATIDITITVTSAADQLSLPLRVVAHP